jgi:hypothetical protein
VVAPDELGAGDSRPYVVLSDGSHPFADEEFLAAIVTTTPRSFAVPLADDDFETGGLPRQSYALPWVLATITSNDVSATAGHPSETVTQRIADEAGDYLGVTN